MGTRVGEPVWGGVHSFRRRGSGVHGASTRGRHMQHPICMTHVGMSSGDESWAKDISIFGTRRIARWSPRSHPPRRSSAPRQRPSHSISCLSLHTLPRCRRVPASAPPPCWQISPFGAFACAAPEFLDPPNHVLTSSTSRPPGKFASTAHLPLSAFYAQPQDLSDRTTTFPICNSVVATFLGPLCK